MVAHPANNPAKPNDEIITDPVQIFREGTRVEAGIQDSMRQVRILHKKMGVPLVGWLDGKMVSIPPEEIQIDAPPAAVTQPQQN
jgi:hypothetical protein